MIGNGLVDGGRITDAVSVSSCAGVSSQPQPRVKREEGGGKDCRHDESIV